jgi:hypothetical protein
MANREKAEGDEEFKGVFMTRLFFGFLCGAVKRKLGKVVFYSKPLAKFCKKRREKNGAVIIESRRDSPKALRRLVSQRG